MPGKEKLKKKGTKHNPLAEDLENDRFATMTTRSAKPQRGDKDSDGYYVPSAVTKKIIGVAQRQITDEDDYTGEDELQPHSAIPGVDLTEEEEEELYGHRDDDEEAEETYSDVQLEYDDAESQQSEMQQFEDLGEEYDIDDEEGRLLEKFQPATSMQSRNLADIIAQKIKEKKAQGAHAAGECDSQAGDPFAKIDRRVVKVYSAIGAVLKNYTSGKIPKAFKVLPHIQNWEQLLLLTRPHDWSPHATYSATRIFAAALNERMAQRFYSAILLPIVHTAIEANKKLHPAQYQAVRKALFKPIAFFKGFLLPLITEAEFECTLKEALIIGSVLQKCHLPPIPTAVTIVKMCEVPFSSAQCVFLRILVDKKMALPYQCIDALILYFHRFVTSHPSDEKLPVLWHQTFLLFVQYYKQDFTQAQLDLLKAVCSKHFHPGITPEVRREIALAEGKKSAYH